jgi:hypothetical protein
MRFLPLLPSGSEAAPWLDFHAVELEWEGFLGAGWAEAVRGGREVHALHLRPEPWKDPLVETALAAFRTRLGIDFLVLRAGAPATRWGKAGFFGILEALLEAATPMGVKIVLRPEPGSVAALLELLREAKADGVGFCWDDGLGPELDLMADRVRCAVGAASVDPAPLQRWGYRWNMAVPGADPGQLAAVLDGLRGKHPTVLFPAEMPSHALGRPVVPDPEVTLGRIWDRGEP